MPKQQERQLSPELEQYLALCERLYQQMVKTGEWPWTDDWREAPDSPEFEDMVESRPNPKNI